MPGTAGTPSAVTATRYLRAGVLARGGLGVVELVVRAEGHFRRLYALKRLHPHLRADPEIRAMFMEEARIAGLIHHPNVVSVLDVGEDDEGPFLLMEYIDGLSLSTLVKETSSREEIVPLGIGLRIARQAAEGLRAAHELVAQDGTPTPAVHRDVSPQNVLVGFDGVVRVVDFGIAKAIGGDDQTTTHALKGKYGYMAPEQLRFERPDPRSDLFALGIVTWELLAGRRLYPGKRLEEIAHRILHEPPPELATERGDVPPELERLLFAMLSKEREHRTPSARAFIDGLDEVLPLVEAQEGTADLRAFLAERFGELREERARARAEALRNLPSGDPQPPTGDAVDVDVAVDAPPDPPAKRSGFRLAIVLAVGALLGAGAILALQGTFAPEATGGAARSIAAERTGPPQLADPPEPVEIDRTAEAEGAGRPEEAPSTVEAPSERAERARDAATRVPDRREAKRRRSARRRARRADMDDRPSEPVKARDTERALEDDWWAP